MAVTKLFFIGSELASAPPSTKRFYTDVSGKRCYVSLGTAAASDWEEIQMVKKSAVSHTTSQTLTAEDNSRILVFSGDSIGVILPDAATLPIGWRVTVVNENTLISQADSATAHAASLTNLPIGKRNILVSRSGTDTLNGVDVQLHGYALIISPRECVDIWMTSSGKFATSASASVGWRSLSLFPSESTATYKAVETQIGTSPFRALRFTKQIAGVEREAYFSLLIPFDYLSGSKVYPFIHWTPGDTTQTLKVAWAWLYSATKSGNQMALPTTPATATSFTTMGSTPYQVYTDEPSDAEAIPPTNLEPNTVLTFKLIRDSGSTNDSFSGSGYLLSAGVHYLSTDGGAPRKVSPYYL
jgi:hypothetical protein